MTNSPWMGPGRAAGRDRGSATAELAMTLPALVILLVAGVATVAAVTVKLGCVAGARDAALSVARGQSVSRPGMTIEADGGFVTATSTKHLRLVEITCSATALREPGLL